MPGRPVPMSSRLNASACPWIRQIRLVAAKAEPASPPTCAGATDQLATDSDLWHPYEPRVIDQNSQTYVFKILPAIPDANAESAGGPSAHLRSTGNLLNFRRFNAVGD